MVAPDDIDDETATRLLVAVFADLDSWLIRHRNVNIVKSGSRLALDDQASMPFPVSHSAHHALTHALDNLRALRAVTVRAQELPLSAGFNLLRGALENAAVGLWVLSPEDRAERVVRRLLLQKKDLSDVAAMSKLNVGHRGPSAETFVAEMTRVGLTVGVDMERLAGQPPSQARIVREAGEVTARGGVHVEATWRICSGLAHGRPWATASALASRNVEEISPGVWDVELRAPLGSLVAVAQTARDVLSEGLRVYVQHRNF